jgi:hypothetical protein
MIRAVLTSGGLGKSTLANKVYTKMKSMGEFSEGSSKYVTFDLYSDSNDNTVIGELHRWLENRTGPILLLLDNVQHQQQLNSILSSKAIVVESFVLITSRKQDLRVSDSFGALGLYGMPTMDYSDALKLFRWHSQGPGTAGVLKMRSLAVYSLYPATNECSPGRISSSCTASELVPASLQLLCCGSNMY